MNIILLLIAIIPVIILASYVYKKDKHKEPTSLLTKFFLCGVFAAIIVVILNLVINIFIPILEIDTDYMNYLELLFYVFIFIAFLEELLKWIFTYKLGYKNQEFDEMYDMVVYSVFTSLGFATVENIIYIFLDGSIGIGIYRGLIAIPGHTCFAIFMGYYLSMAKLYSINNNYKQERLNKIKSIIIPIILHCIYDYCCFAGTYLFLIIFFVFIINLYLYAHNKLKYISSMLKNVKYKNYYCPNCGNKVEDNYCKNCGFKQE